MRRKALSARVKPTPAAVSWVVGPYLDRRDRDHGAVVGYRD
jgi:hypothetical protein